jgi:hypothetical protein
MLEIGNIVKGHLNEVLGLNKDLKEQRLRICYMCPLYSKKYGGICNNKLFLNPITGDVSLSKKEGYKQGCGCRILAKTTLP